MTFFATLHYASLLALEPTGTACSFYPNVAAATQMLVAVFFFSSSLLISGYIYSVTDKYYIHYVVDIPPLDYSHAVCFILP